MLAGMLTLIESQSMGRPLLVFMTCDLAAQAQQLASYQLRPTSFSLSRTFLFLPPPPPTHFLPLIHSSSYPPPPPPTPTFSHKFLQVPARPQPSFISSQTVPIIFLRRKILDPALNAFVYCFSSVPLFRLLDSYKFLFFLL